MAVAKMQVLDASFINCKMLRRFFEEQIAEAKEFFQVFFSRSTREMVWDHRDLPVSSISRSQPPFEKL